MSAPPAPTPAPPTTTPPSAQRARGSAAAAVERPRPCSCRPKRATPFEQPPSQQVPGSDALAVARPRRRPPHPHRRLRRDAPRLPGQRHDAAPAPRRPLLRLPLQRLDQRLLGARGRRRQRLRDRAVVPRAQAVSPPAHRHARRAHPRAASASSTSSTSRRRSTALIAPPSTNLIIPTTWRELGFGFFGRITPDLHFQLYAMDGPDGSKFTPQAASAPGSTAASPSTRENAAVVGRLDWTGVLGLDVGASATTALPTTRTHAGAADRRLGRPLRSGRALLALGPRAARRVRARLHPGRRRHHQYHRAADGRDRGGGRLGGAGLLLRGRLQPAASAAPHPANRSSSSVATNTSTRARRCRPSSTPSSRRPITTSPSG